MAPNVDWDNVLSVDVSLLQDDEESADRLFHDLVDADVRLDSQEASDASKMVQLFNVVQAVMKVKNVQYEAAMDELENVMKDGAGSKENYLMDEVEALQKELAHYQKFAGTDDKFLKAEISQLEEKNKLLEKELEEFERKLVKEQRQSDKVSKQCEELEVKNTELRRETERLRTNIKDYARQLESRRESQLLRREEDMNVKDQISNKNKELSRCLDEIRDLQNENDSLQKEINIAQQELKEASVAMNGMADDYSRLKGVLEDRDILLERSRQEGELLRAQVEDLQQQAQSKTDVDDEMMAAFNKKVEEWKIVLATKDEEIVDLNKIVFDLQGQLQAARMDTDKNAVAELILAANEKDEKIKELKKSLEEATREMKFVTDQIEDVKIKSKKDGGPSIKQQSKIATLSQTLQNEQLNAMKEKEHTVKLESDVIERDKTISELRARMLQYELGQFGLPEAVQEIKEFRTQIKIRDKNIEDLTRTLNQVQMELNDIELENEELRERLGIDAKLPVDATSIRKKKQVREEQALALNRALAREVERLEEERLHLKKMLRKQAMHRGERAVELGITTEDLEAVEESALRSEQPIKPVAVQRVNADATSVKIQESLKKEKLKFEDLTEKQKNKLEKVESENKELKDENRQLEIGLREILATIKDNRLKQENGPMELNIPALEKLIAMIESRNAAGQYDVTMNLKGQIENLNGRNEELRVELKNSRNEVNNLVTEIERKEQKVSQLEKEIELIREAGQGIIKLNPLQLPEGMTPSSADIIGSLNEFLIQILQELANREETVKQYEENLESYKRKFSVAMHQQSILYSQYLDEKEQREAEFKKMQEENSTLRAVREQDKIRIQEYDRLCETLKQDPSKQKSRAAEYARKMTVLRVNEKSLARRYTILSESEDLLRKENNKLKADITTVENAVTERIGYLTRYKEMANYRIAALQKALDNSVPELELQLANKQYNELTAKYRDVLQRENTLITRSSAVENLEFEVQRLQDSELNLKKQLQAEKERSHALEQSLEFYLQKAGSGAGAGTIRGDEVMTIARQLATLEMKELNERQKAEHAVRKFEQLKGVIAELENRNSELEQRFAELSRINLEAQKVERDLRDELINAVPASVNLADKKRIEQLEESEAKLRLEMTRLKEVSDIATHQAETILSRQQVQEKELTSLRRQLHDIQMESDEKTIIAKLHQHIVAQQLSEATAVMKMQATSAKVKKLEVAILRVEQQLDEKYQILYRTRTEARAKTRFLKKTIQDLRRQFSGALPLIRQEKFTHTLKTLQENKTQQDVELKLAKTKSHEAEERSLELEMKLVGLQELIVTLKDGKGAQKVAEWHAKMGDMRLQDMKLKRQVEKSEQRIKYIEEQNRKLEDSISLMEDEYYKQSKEYEDRQLVWEQHEVELERKIARLEKNQDELFEAAQKFEEATGSVLDPSLPIANQLEMAIVKLKEHIKTIIITRAESRRMKESLEEAEKKLGDFEKKHSKKDKLINELRLRLPISEREIVEKESEKYSKESSPEEYHAQNALKVAQSTIESLKVMLKRKEESITKYQEMMAALREEMKRLSEVHKSEVKEIQGKLHAEMEEKVQKLKKLHLDYINAPRPPVATEKQLNRLSDLEEMVAEQDNKLAVADMNFKKAKDEIEKLKERSEVDIKMMKKKMRRRDEEHNSEVEKLNKEIEAEQNKVTELNKEQFELYLVPEHLQCETEHIISKFTSFFKTVSVWKEFKKPTEQVEILNDDLLAAKEANERAPTKTMKALVERLRNQLALKEKQQKALSQALLQLRRDMVSQAEDNVTTHANKAEEELNIQRIVDKQTSVLETRIEELQARQDKLKSELKQKRESEETMRAEVTRLKRDNDRKEAGVRKLAVELKGREEMDEQIEDLRSEIKSLEKFRTEAEKLRKRVQVLEEEQQIEVQQAEAVQTGANVDFLSDKDEVPTKDKKSREEVIRWEENKKWQKRIETLKAKLKEKTEELEKAEKNNQMMKDIISRNDKEKAAFQAKLKSSMRAAEESSHITSSSKEEIVQGLKARIFQLEEENNNLHRKLALDRDNEIGELRIKNSQLLETIRALETELANKEADDKPAVSNWSVAREESFQKEILEVRKENMELKFENERAQVNLPRLQARVKDLEEYCEILKSELEAAKKREKQRKTAMGTGMGGQSVEDLERVIAAMRRVIERLQGENDNLKKQSSKTRIPPHSDIARENRQLKQEIQKLKTKEGGESTRATTTNKLVQENEKIRRELKKNVDAMEKLRNASSSAVIEKEKMEKELMKTKEKLAAAEARAPKLEGADKEQWKSVVMTKMSEERVAKVEAELDRKTKLLQELKTHLRSAAEREAELLRREDEYKEKICLLERYPSDIKTDSDVVQHLQKARLRINTLEAEKNELLEDISRLRELSNNGENPINLEDDEVLEKLRKYDKLLAVEVELRMKLRGAHVELEGAAAENSKLQRELEAFDPSFFEEIEDLKYNYKKSVERNVLYERQLRQFSRNFGVDVNIPDDGDY